jgi:hypothetical protein
VAVADWPQPASKAASTTLNKRKFTFILHLLCCYEYRPWGC